MFACLSAFVFLVFLAACEDETEMGELTRENTLEEATDVGRFPVGGEGTIRIEEARWRGEEIVALGVVEGEGVVDCDPIIVSRRNASRGVVGHDADGSRLEVVGNTFLQTFVADEDGWEPGADYRVRCSLLGNRDYDPSFDERNVEGEPPA